MFDNTGHTTSQALQAQGDGYTQKSIANLRLGILSAAKVGQILKGKEPTEEGEDQENQEAQETGWLSMSRMAVQ